MSLRTLVLCSILCASIPNAVRAAPFAPGDTASTVVLNADFNADVVGLPPDVTLPGAPAGDFLTLNQTAGTVTVANSIDGLTNQPVEMKQSNAPGGVGISAWIAPIPPGLERATVRWRSLARDQNPVFLLRCSVRSASGAVIASVDYRPHGELTYNLGSALPVAYQNNRAQQFTIAIDFLSSTTSLSIDGTPVPGFQSVPFASPAADLARIACEGDESHPQSLVIDDISAVVLTRVPDQAPVVTAPPAVDGEEGGTIRFPVSATDPDGEAVTLSADLTGLPATSDATFTEGPGPGEGEFLWHPMEGEGGTFTVTFTAANSSTGTAETVVTVAQSGVSLTGTLIWTPPPGSEGSHFVTFTATDSFGDSNSSVTEIVVSAPTSAAPIPANSPPAPLAPLAPGQIQKGPVVSSPTRTDATVGKTTTVTATATDTTATGGTTSGTGLAPARVSLAGFAASRAASLTLTADLTEVPGAVFVVDEDPLVSAPSAITVDAGETASAVVSASDPDGDPILGLTVDTDALPDPNNAAFAVNGTNTAGTFTWTPAAGDSGSYTVTFRAANELVGEAHTVIHVRGAARARVFLPSNPKIRLMSNKPADCVYLEPIEGSFDLFDVDLSSIRMISPGTGSVTQIAPSTGKSVVLGDKDGNLVQDLQLCFGKGDLRLLFSDLRGNNNVTVTVAGLLVTGRAFAGAVNLPVVAGSGSFQASIAPNPLNPLGTLRFVTRRPGPVSVRVYDLAGRLVRDLGGDVFEAGDHAIAIDGRDQAGQRLASGVYFYRIEMDEEVETGRFTIMK